MKRIDWNLKSKLRIVEECLQANASVGLVASKYDLDPSIVYSWISELKNQASLNWKKRSVNSFMGWNTGSRNGGWLPHYVKVQSLKNRRKKRRKAKKK